MGSATIADMTAASGDPALPELCLEWCRTHSYDHDVLHDVATVDLDWWNTRLDRAAIPVRLHGRTSQRVRTDTGIAVLERGELRADARDLAYSGPPELVRLYLCVAWLMGNLGRGRAKRFPDVRDTEPTHPPLAQITRALASFERSPALIDVGPQRQWSGWPVAPGVGATPLSLYAWAVCSDSSLQCPQLVDQQGLASLVHHGWVDNPAIGSLTLSRYVRYCALLARWSYQAGVPSELIELWLARSWRARQQSPSPFMNQVRGGW